MSNLKHWLSDSVTVSPDEKYRHRRLKENLNYRSKIIPELKLIIQKAHEDAHNHLRKGYSDDLDPFNNPSQNCAVVEQYPKFLHIQTLKGYFGEIFAGIISQNFAPFGIDSWEIPAYPFRFHNTAFEQLEMLSQTEEGAGMIPGRTGDDCLAFQRDSNGKIIKSLICEAKCTPTHQLKMIAEAHEKASTPNPKPVILKQLIDILKESKARNSSQWIDSLRQLLLQDKKDIDYERCDLISYICGLPPVREKTVIIPVDKPHEQYTGQRKLESCEIHLYDVEGLIEEVYEKQDHIECIKKKSCSNLAEIWDKVLISLESSNSNELISEYCDLLAFDGQTALISVSSLSVFRDVQRREDKIKDAFSNSGIFPPCSKRKSKNREEKVKIKLTVVKAEEKQNDSTKP